ncbi:hypothetical protein [Streptomyces fractus]|uniref:hypothetical protein n=1 Tax=Streptomyces fractus TaxID=641806 RepID=UPI003CFB4773
MTTLAANRRPVVPVAAGTGVVALLLLLVGGYLETPFRSGEDGWGLSAGHGLLEVPVAVGFVAAGVAVVFGVVVRRALLTPPVRTARTALIVTLVGVPAVLVFWTGLPVVLASAGAYLALDARRRHGAVPATAVAALILSALIVAEAVRLAFTG